MKYFFAAALVGLLPSFALAQTAREIVIAGYEAVFINPDRSKIDTYFSEDYKQHNPGFPDGLDVLRKFASEPMEGVTAQIGNVIADEEQGLVALHVRVEGFGPKPLVIVDIFRVEDGKIVQHWDVLQEEVAETVSGNPMWTPAGE